MPPTGLIQIGLPFAMTQNIVYACPVRRTVGHVNPVAASGLEGSMTVGGTFTAIVVAADGSFTANTAFIRSTAAGTTVLFKA